MTDEEKAREFLSHIIAEFDDNSRNRENIVALGKLFEACFLSACEWKDQQHAKITSKIIKEDSNASFESGFAEGERKTEARFREKLEQMMKVAYFDKEVYKHIITELFEEAK